MRATWSRSLPQSRIFRTILIRSNPRRCSAQASQPSTRCASPGAGPRDLAAVLGVGGLGHLGVQYAARHGFRTVAVNRGREKEELAKKARRQRLHRHCDRRPSESANRDGRRAGLLATVTNAEAMQAIAGGLGLNGVMMVIGAVAPLTVNSSDLIGKSAGVRAGIPAWRAIRRTRSPSASSTKSCQ